MTGKRTWFDSPVFNWAGAAVSLVMLVLYLQQLTGPSPRHSTPYVSAAWALIFVVWLGTAAYKSWCRKV